MTDSSQTVNILSFNVNGIVNPQKRSKILSKLKKEKVHVALLQETHLSDQEHKKLRRGFYKYVYASSYRSGHRRGAAILISRQINFEYLSDKKDKDGRYVLIKGRIDGFPVTILSVYAPPGSDWVFYKQLFELMASETEGMLICGGDMNIRLSKLDSSKKELTQQKSLIRKINCIMDETGIIDIWRDFYPTSRDFTHFSATHSTYSRIDYFFTFSKDRHKVKTCDIGTIDL